MDYEKKNYIEAIEALRNTKKPKIQLHDFIRVMNKAKLVLKMAGDRTKAYIGTSRVRRWDPNLRQYVIRTSTYSRNFLEEDTTLMNNLLNKMIRGPKDGTYYPSFKSINFSIPQYRFADLAKYFKGFIPGLTQEKARQAYRYLNLLKEMRRNRNLFNGGSTSYNRHPKLTFLSTDLVTAISSMVGRWNWKGTDTGDKGLRYRFLVLKLPKSRYPKAYDEKGQLLHREYSMYQMKPVSSYENDAPLTETGKEIIKMQSERGPVPSKYASYTDYIHRDKNFHDIYMEARKRIMKRKEAAK